MSLHSSSKMRKMGILLSRVPRYSSIKIHLVYITNITVSTDSLMASVKVQTIPCAQGPSLVLSWLGGDRLVPLPSQESDKQLRFAELFIPGLLLISSQSLFFVPCRHGKVQTLLTSASYSLCSTYIHLQMLNDFYAFFLESLKCFF